MTSIANPCRAAGAIFALIFAPSFVWAQGYEIANLVASDALTPAVLHDPTLVDAWGIAIRPAGTLGGHFWLSAYGNGTSNQYVGDVGGTPIFQDALRNMDIPPFPTGFTPPAPSGASTFIPDGLGVARITGQTWQQTAGFVTTLPHLNGSIVAPAKFLFATEDGVISAWTDNKQPNGTPNWVGYSVAEYDGSAAGSKFFGITVSTQSGYAYVADLGDDPGIKVLNADFSLRNDFVDAFNPFLGGDGFQPGEYTAFGLRTALNTGAGNLFVTYQKSLANLSDPLHIAPGLGDVGPGNGRLAEYDPSGALVAVWDDGGLLNSPWDVAFAPADFGPASGMLLVSNAGDGTIAILDPATRAAVDYLRDSTGAIVTIDGLKGLTFGNGFSLGDSNSLYFTAGPNAGADGLFGRITYAVPEPSAATLAGAFALSLAIAGTVKRYAERRQTSLDRGPTP